MENLSIWTSQETWLRVHDTDPRAWIVPSWNGQPRVNKPPLLVWANLLAWADLSPATADLPTLIRRARWLGAGFALLALLATAWAGWGVGGPRLAWLSALIGGTAFLFVRQARYATYDTHLLGWLTLSVAAALHAMAVRRPRDEMRRRRWAWVLSGAALSAAWLAKGPLALVLGLGPLAAMALGLRDRRGPALAGVAFAAALAAALAAPWYAHVLRTVPGAGDRMFFEYRAVRDQFQSPFYYVGLVGLVFPWTWVFLRSVARWFDRRTRPVGPDLLPWLWFGFVFAFLSIPGAKQQRYIVPALPAVAILAAQTWLSRSVEGGRPWQMRADRFLQAAHGWTLVAGGLGLSVFLLLHDRLVERGVLDRPQVAGVPTWLAVLLAPVLGGLGWSVLRWTRGPRVEAAAWGTAAWMAVAATVGFGGYAMAGHGAYRFADEARSVHRLVGDTPFYSVTLGRKSDMQMSKEFLLYTRRVVPVLAPGQVRAREKEGKPFYLAARAIDDTDFDPRRDGQGWDLVREFRDGEKKPLRLFLFRPE